MNLWGLRALSQLERVVDPEVGLDIVAMGLIYGLEAGPDAIRLRMTLTSPGCPVGESILEMCEQALQEVAGAGIVDIELVWDPPWNPAMISAQGRERLQL